MSDFLTFALAQLNPSVGDIAGNCNKLLSVWRNAGNNKVDIVVTGELFATGYPPEDFTANPNLIKLARDSINALARKTASGPALLIGAPWVIDEKLYNAALLLDGGKIAAIVCKHDLPNYGPFDEKRVFTPGPLAEPVEFRGYCLGVMICEDMWTDETAKHLKQAGAQALIVVNGSPFEAGKQAHRELLAHQRIKETRVPLVYVNQVGGQDELVFDGASFVMDASGQIKAQAKAWEEETLIIQAQHIDNTLSFENSSKAVLPEDEEAIYNALLTGVRDYVTKNNFERILLGLSGGIDSALVAALAVDAFGADKVRTVMMPSPYTSQTSLDDAQAVAKALGCRLDTIPITETMKAFENALAESFIGCQPDITEENIQARCRGVLLMALANKSNGIVLATGNKSELSTGYATLYGDLCGGYAPLKDVYKTFVYKLAHWRNKNKPAKALGPANTIFPESVLTKAPTAELKPNQTDQDTLPPYDVLDGILEGLIEKRLSLAEVTSLGFNADLVRRVWTMLLRSEYKRRQAPPGPKITSRHLTRDRRYPITNNYVEKEENR